MGLLPIILGLEPELVGVIIVFEEVAEGPQHVENLDLVGGFEPLWKGNRVVGLVGFILGKHHQTPKKSLPIRYSTRTS